MPFSSCSPGCAAATVGDPVEALEELAELHRSGVLTDAEFLAAKTKLLAPSTNAALAQTLVRALRAGMDGDLETVRTRRELERHLSTSLRSARLVGWAARAESVRVR
jgi:hypothetical protein